MKVSTRDDLERAAIVFFKEMVVEIEEPRPFEMFDPDDERDFNIEHSQKRIAALDVQLRENVFDTVVKDRALALARSLDADADPTSDELKFALQLSARAEREQLAFLLHKMATPAKTYRLSDELFDERGPRLQLHQAETPQLDVKGLTLLLLAERYVSMKQNLQHVKTQIEDSSRVLRWLGERIGPNRPINQVTKPELRSFRDDLLRLAKTKKGQATSFADRLTDLAPDQVASVTAIRYWGFVRSFFTWASAEGYIDNNPALDLIIPKRKGEVRKSPPPFTVGEIQALLATPMYAGHSLRRWTSPGSCFRRDGKWWSGVLFMFTGLRAGELAQLEPNDFDFDGPIPFVNVRREGAAGAEAKTVKNTSSIRQIPLAPLLLELGLKQFVTGKSKMKHARVFDNFRLGAGRASDGISKFWRQYLLDFGLWKAGRSTHVWRHTVIARLRDAGVAQEDIASIVGHEQGTMTSTYGGAYSLARKSETMKKLDYGFDVMSTLGGPYQKALHG